MIKDYINKMLEDNREELEKQEIVMNNLLIELESSQKQLLQLRREKSTDKNLFSPRNYDFEADIKIEKARDKIEKTKNEIEYTRERIETFLKKKKEFELLLEEATECSNEIENNTKDTMDNSIEKVLSCEKSCIITDTVNKECNSNENVFNINNSLDFLKEVYKKIEISLALLNSDKNKCKIELKSVLKLLKDTVVKIENEKES